MSKMNYTAVIVDDEAICIQNIQESLAYFPEVNLLGAVMTAEEGMKLIIKERPNLLFLDVELPSKSGIELLHELQPRITWEMRVVFYTSHQKYWLDAIRESAFDYLLKPYTAKEFTTVMRRFFEHFGAQTYKLEAFEKLIQELLPSQQTFMVADVTGYRVLRISEVGYFAYSNPKRQWCAMLANCKEVWLARNTKSEQILSFSSYFMQINRHQIININYVCSIKGKSCNLIPPFDGEKELYISRNYQAAVHEKFCLM